MIWQEKMMVASVLYMLLEQGEVFEKSIITGHKDNSKLLSSVLDDMYKNGLLSLTGTFTKKYVVTDAGRKQMGKLIGVLDTIRQFNPCISVCLRELEPNEWLSEDAPAEVRWDILDPRFLDPADESGVDMRLALIQWAGEKIGKDIDPHEVVFLFRLGSGRYSTQDFQYRLLDGSIFSDVEYTVANSFKWQDMDPDGNPDVASRRMQGLYTACMVENRKRDGFPCSGCGAPMAMFQKDAQEQGVVLGECPCCGRRFNPPPPEAYECPRCKNMMWPGDSICSGCGAMVDTSLPLGTFEGTDTVTEETVVFSDNYGYVSYGWMDPYDVLVSAYMFDVLCDHYW